MRKLSWDWLIIHPDYESMILARQEEQEILDERCDSCRPTNLGSLPDDDIYLGESTLGDELDPEDEELLDQILAGEL